MGLKTGRKERNKGQRGHKKRDVDSDRKECMETEKKTWRRTLSNVYFYEHSRFQLLRLVIYSLSVVASEVRTLPEKRPKKSMPKEAFWLSGLLS